MENNKTVLIWEWTNWIVATCVFSAIYVLFNLLTQQSSITLLLAELPFLLFATILYGNPRKLGPLLVSVFAMQLYFVLWYLVLDSSGNKYLDFLIDYDLLVVATLIIWTVIFKSSKSIHINVPQSVNLAVAQASIYMFTVLAVPYLGYYAFLLIPVIPPFPPTSVISILLLLLYLIGKFRKRFDTMISIQKR